VFLAICFFLFMFFLFWLVFVRWTSKPLLMNHPNFQCCMAWGTGRVAKYTINHKQACK
jgi:hypothetical protein